MNADLIERLREDAKIGDSGATCIDYSPIAIRQIADALEQLERKCAELALENSAMRLALKKMEARRR